MFVQLGDEFHPTLKQSLAQRLARSARRSGRILAEELQVLAIHNDSGSAIGEKSRRDQVRDRQIELLGFDAGHDMERFREKTFHFLKARENDPVIRKLHWNEPLTKQDIDALEKMLVEAGAGTPGEVSKIRSDGDLGLFVRSIVGLDREAAKRAFDGFLAGKTFTANQIQFVNLLVDYLTQSGWMSPAQLYESPFTDYSPRGVEGVFDSAQVTQLLSILNSVRQAAVV